MCVRAQSLQSCPTLCDPMDYCPSGSSVHGILQARILECAATPCSGDLPNLGTEPTSLVVLTLAGGFFSTSATCKDPLHICLPQLPPSNSPRNRTSRSQNDCLRGLINSCEKKRSERERRKGKINPSKLRVTKNSKER